MMRLKCRQPCLMWAMIGVSSSLVLYILAIRPALERIETLNRVIPENQSKLQQLRVKSEQLLALDKTLEKMESATTVENSERELVPFLEATCKECGLSSQVTTMKQEVVSKNSGYREVIVETKLESIAFKQLVELLLKIRSSQYPLCIQSLYVEKNDAQSDLVDTVIIFNSLRVG